MNSKIILFILCILKSNLTFTYLDTSFGPNNTGVVTVCDENDIFLESIKIQNDGKIVGAGYSTDKNNIKKFLVARFNSNGSLDHSFGYKGIIKTAVGIDSQANDLIIQPNGKIVVAGLAGNPSTLTYKIAVARYNSDGTLDNSFYAGFYGAPVGYVTTLIGSYAMGKSVKLQSDGKIIVGGSTIINGISNFVAVRYHSNGSLDTGFNSTGFVTYSIGINSAASFIGLQSDGKIVLTGMSTSSCWTNKITAIRFNQNGSLDYSFGNNGIAATEIPQLINVDSATISEDDRIIISGFTSNLSEKIVLLRYAANGNRDNSFGSNGLVYTQIHSSTRANSVITQAADGKIIVGGFTKQLSQSQTDWMTIRYNVNGNTDSSFGSNGVIVTPIGNESAVQSLAIQTDNKVVSAGYSKDPITNNYKIVLARYNNTNNFITICSPAYDSVVHSKKIVISGNSSASSATVEILLNNKLVANTTTSNSGSWSICLPHTLPNGQNIIKVNLIVDSEEIASAGTSFIVDIPSDIVQILTPSHNSASYSGLPISITGTSSLPNAQILITLDSHYFNSVTTDDSGNWNAGIINSLSNGNHVLMAILVNCMGNTLAVATSKFNINI